jgi:hypothetical protein
MKTQFSFRFSVQRLAESRSYRSPLLPLIAGVLFSSLLVFMSPSIGRTWGFFAHKLIHQQAIELLPQPLQSFYRGIADSVVEKSTEPDLRRNSAPNEQWHHYIDIDHYGAYPFRELPRDYSQAAAKFSADTLLAYGDVPWHVEKVLGNLVAAMRVKDKRAIVQLSADLGHYVADVHVPLHSTLNYDGQLTGNKGIHGRFESAMVERYSDRLAFSPAQLDSIDNATGRVFEIILDSYVWVDNTLHADQHAREPGKDYQSREDYDDAYYAKLHGMLGQVAQHRLSAAATTVASFWYTAWLRAGRPALL